MTDSGNALLSGKKYATLSVSCLSLHIQWADMRLVSIFPSNSRKKELPADRRQVTGKTGDFFCLVSFKLRKV